VRLEARLDTHVADLWSVLADPDCLNRWLGEVEGDLSPPWTTSPPMGRETRFLIEDLVAYLAGHERCDPRARWKELLPAYENQAAGLDRAEDG
jgi:hypothetical protein